MKLKAGTTLVLAFLVSCSPRSADNANESQDPVVAEARAAELERTRLEAAKREADRLALEEQARAAREEKERAEATKAREAEEAAQRAEEERIAAAKEKEAQVAAVKAARVQLTGSQLELLTLKDGETFQNVTIREITDLEVSIAHENGMASIKLAELAPADQERFHFDPHLYLEAVAAVEAVKEARAAARDAGQPKADTASIEAERMKAADKKDSLIRAELAREEAKLQEMRTGLANLITQREAAVEKFSAEDANARRIRNTRYDGISGNDRIGGISTSKADRSKATGGYDSRIQAGENLIRECEKRIRELQGQL